VRYSETFPSQSEKEQLLTTKDTKKHEGKPLPQINADERGSKRRGAGTKSTPIEVQLLISTPKWDVIGNNIVG
jgi:hypothetical protein